MKTSYSDQTFINGLGSASLRAANDWIAQQQREHRTLRLSSRIRSVRSGKPGYYVLVEEITEE